MAFLAILNFLSQATLDHFSILPFVEQVGCPIDFEVRLEVVAFVWLFWPSCSFSPSRLMPEIQGEQN